jgi:hypothetical protein
VKTRTLADLFHMPPGQLEALRAGPRSGPGGAPLPVAFTIVRTRGRGPVAAGLGTLRPLGLDRLLAGVWSRARDLCVATIVARVLDPRSKLATARGLGPETLAGTLGKVLGGGGGRRRRPLRRHGLAPAPAGAPRGGPGAAAPRRGVSDVTATYFEGRTCPLGPLGHHRDGKPGKLQIVCGLLTAADGCPVALEAFDGATGDPTTLPAQVQYGPPALRPAAGRVGGGPGA